MDNDFIRKYRPRRFKPKKLSYEPVYRGNVEPVWLDLNDLVSDTIKLVPKIPENVDAIIGVARSGLIPASIISTYLHLPLFSVSWHEPENIVNLSGGHRKPSIDNIKRVVVIDDSTASGTTWENLKALDFKFPEVITAAIYVEPFAKIQPKIIGRYLSLPHLFSWNFFNNYMMEVTGIDFDGILCPDPPFGSGPEYELWLSDAKRLLAIRMYKVKAIITARGEKYRNITEAWLKRYGIAYQNLIMAPEHGMSVDDIIKFKYDTIKKLGLTYFVESADDIARRLTGSCRYVICPAAKKVYMVKEHG